MHNDITNADGLVIAANFVDSGSTAEFLWTEIGTGITTDASVLFQYMYALLWRRACRRGGTLSEREHHTWAFVSDLSAVRKGEQIFKCAVAQLVRLVSWRRRTSAKYQPGGATQRREMWQLQTCNSWDVLINTLEPYSSSSGSLFSSNYSLTLVYAATADCLVWRQLFTHLYVGLLYRSHRVLMWLALYELLLNRVYEKIRYYWIVNELYIRPN